MGISRRYLSSDGNAPVLNGISGSLVNVLKKCLVEGYGTKQAAGWEMPFANVGETVACFRSATPDGTNFFLQVTNAGAAASCFGYESMTSESAGVNRFGSGLSLPTSQTADATARPWVLIATDKYVYFFSYKQVTSMPLLTRSGMASSTYAGICFFFGDIEKAYPDDGFASAMFCSQTGTSGSGFGSAAELTRSTSSNLYMARALSGAVGQRQVATYQCPPGPSGENAFGAAGPGYSAAVGLMVSKAVINDGVVGSFRGWFPGLYVPCCTSEFTNLDTMTINGSTYAVVNWKVIANTAATHTAQAFIKVDA